MGVFFLLCEFFILVYVLGHVLQVFRSWCSGLCRHPVFVISRCYAHKLRIQFVTCLSHDILEKKRPPTAIML